MPNVVHVVPSLFDGDIGIVGGAERYALELGRAMATVTSTRLVTFGTRRESRRVGDLVVEILEVTKSSEPSRIPFSFALFDILDDADIIHCHQLMALSTTLSAAYANRMGRPVFVTDLGGGPPTNGFNPDTTTWFDAHLHISEFSMRGESDAQLERSEVIGAGVDSKAFSIVDDYADFREVVFVGRVLPHKGIDVLITALPVDMTLTIVGRVYDQRYFTDLKALAEGKSVAFLTEADDDTLVVRYRKAAIVVLPSVNRTLYGEEILAPELLGQTLLEGMACGKPAICSNTGGMPEIVVDGVTGLVVPPGDTAALRGALEFLRDNPALAREMGIAGRNRVSDQFTWSSVVGRCLAAYERSLVKRRSIA